MKVKTSALTSTPLSKWPGWMITEMITQSSAKLMRLLPQKENSHSSNIIIMIQSAKPAWQNKSPGCNCSEDDISDSEPGKHQMEDSVGVF